MNMLKKLIEDREKFKKIAEEQIRKELERIKSELECSNLEEEHKVELEHVMYEHLMRENEMLRMRVRELEMELANKTTEN